MDFDMELQYIEADLRARYTALLDDKTEDARQFSFFDTRAGKIRCNGVFSSSQLHTLAALCEEYHVHKNFLNSKHFPGV